MTDETYRCGHPRTPENTHSHKNRDRMWDRCRICQNERKRLEYHQAPSDVNKLYRRIRHVPVALKRAREKVAKLEAEARELGMHDLIQNNSNERAA